MARVRVAGGRIDAAGLDAVAGAAERWGSGVVEITSRANLQLRGVRTHAALPLAEALISSGVSGGPLADRRRNVLMDPLGDLDPTALDFGPVLAPLLARLDADPRLDELDDKFGFALDGGGSWSLGGRRATVVASTGARPGRVDVRCAWADEGSAGSAAAPWSVPYHDLPELLATAAAESLARPRRSLLVAAPPEGDVRLAGPLGAGDGWVGAMPVLGRADAATFAAIAAAARRYSAGRLRLTPWRGVVFPGVAPGDRAGLVADLRAAGLVVEPEDPASPVIACAGRKGCTSGLTDAVGDARRVISGRREGGLEPSAVHVSGCAKCCAEHAPVAVTLIGSGEDRYDVYLEGELRASAIPAADAVALVSSP